MNLITCNLIYEFKSIVYGDRTHLFFEKLCDLEKYADLNNYVLEYSRRIENKKTNTCKLVYVGY